MTLQDFKDMVSTLKDVHIRTSEANKLAIDLIEYEDPFHRVIGQLLTELYGEEGYDWIMWFFYDCDFGAKYMEANDAEGNSICYDVESLWNYLEKNYSKTKR